MTMTCLSETARQFLAQVAEAGIDYVGCGDHVSFLGGSGFDGLCTEFNLIPQSPDHDQAIAGVASVKKLLAQT
jgi:hypothetical protein